MGGLGGNGVELLSRGWASKPDLTDLIFHSFLRASVPEVRQVFVVFSAHISKCSTRYEFLHVQKKLRKFLNFN